MGPSSGKAAATPSAIAGSGTGNGSKAASGCGRQRVRKQLLSRSCLTRWTSRCASGVLDGVEHCLHGQRSSRAAESKRRALGNYVSERICCMFLISKCRGDRDLGLCTTSVLAFGDPQRNGDFRRKNVFRRRKNRILPLRCGFPNTSPEVVHRPRSRSPLQFDIRNI